MVAENILTPADFILPLFVCEGMGKINAIDSMPGVYRYSVDQLAPIVEEASSLGVSAYAIFPQVDPADKTPDARESYNPDNLICRSIRAIRASHPEVGIICDAALDPFNSDGHDGLLVDGHVVNDESVETPRQEAKKLLAELSIVKLENYDLTKPLKQSEKDEIFRPFVSDSEILGNKKNYSLLTELKTSGSDDTHQEIHFYGSPSVSIGQEHGRFQPVSSATYSFTRDDDLMETTLRNRISAESVSEEDIEAFERKFVLSEGDRYFHRDNFNEPNTYNFSVKSTHYYSSEMLFKKSIAILVDKCQKMKQSFIHLLQDKEHRAIDVEEKNDYLYHFLMLVNF